MQFVPCPKCGAPIYLPSVWHGITPPPQTPSCNCWNLGTHSNQEYIPSPEYDIPHLNIPQVEIPMTTELAKKFQLQEAFQEFVAKGTQEAKAKLLEEIETYQKGS